METWLQRFRGIVGSWQLSLRLLSVPGAQEHEILFAANSLKSCACKSAVRTRHAAAAACCCC